MAVDRSDGTTTLTPTRWKWVIGAIFLLAMPGLGFFVSALFLTIAFGGMHRLVLKPHGFEVRRWGKTSEYRWDEVGSFEVHTFRYMFIPLVRRITFTPTTKEGKLLTRASKIIAGGTERVPAIGISAKKLAVLMNEHRDQYIAEYGLQPAQGQGDFAPTQRRWGEPARQYEPPEPLMASKRASTPKPERKSHDLEPLGKKPKQDPLVQDSFLRKWRTRD